VRIIRARACYFRLVDFDVNLHKEIGIFHLTMMCLHPSFGQAVDARVNEVDIQSMSRDCFQL